MIPVATTKAAGKCPRPFLVRPLAGSRLWQHPICRHETPLPLAPSPEGRGGIGP